MGNEAMSNPKYTALPSEEKMNTADFTPRVMPYRPGALVPLEAAQILWQK